MKGSADAEYVSLKLVVDQRSAFLVYFEFGISDRYLSWICVRQVVDAPATIGLCVFHLGGTFANYHASEYGKQVLKFETSSFTPGNLKMSLAC